MAKDDSKKNPNDPFENFDPDSLSSSVSSGRGDGLRPIRRLEDEAAEVYKRLDQEKADADAVSMGPPADLKNAAVAGVTNEISPERMAAFRDTHEKNLSMKTVRGG